MFTPVIIGILESTNKFVFHVHLSFTHFVHKKVQNNNLVQPYLSYLFLKRKKLTESFPRRLIYSRSKIQLFRWLWQQRGLFLVNVFTLDVFSPAVIFSGPCSCGWASSHPSKRAILSGLNEMKLNLFSQEPLHKIYTWFPGKMHRSDQSAVSSLISLYYL